MSELQDNNSSSTSEPQDNNSSSILTKFFDNIFSIAIVLFVVVSFVWAYVSDLPIEESYKPWIMVGLGAFVSLLGVIIIAIIFRENRTVAWVTNFLTLLVITCILALVPVVFSQGAQVLFLKIGAIIFLSLLPSWLYLQFINVKGKALYDEYVLNLYRLQADDYRNLPKPASDSLYYEIWKSWHEKESDDPPINLYTRKFDGQFGEALGSSVQDISGRFQKENFFPVLFTTLLITVGWVVVLQPEAVFGLHLSVEPIPSGVPALPGTALAYGFVGAYFFIVQMLIRRYFQDDLKTSAYINATARIIAVILLVVVLHTLWPLSEQQEYAFAFLIGIFPQVGLQAIQALVNIFLRGLLPGLKKDYPLSDLDGLNVWYESRLLEEGIEDLQNLATSNLVDVMLRTRVPMDRLVDWVDQAHLYLRVRNDDGEEKQEGDNKQPSSREKPRGLGKSGNKQPSSREKLRRLGIRTATDLQDAMAWPIDSFPIEKKPLSEEQDDLVKRLRWVLNEKEKPDTPSVVDAILHALENEPNLYHVRAWRNYTNELSRHWKGLLDEDKTPSPESS